MDIQSEQLEKILQSSKDDVDSMFDEKARAEYLKGVAKIYETKVHEQELKDAEENRKIEKKRIRSETATKIVDSVLRFVGTFTIGGASILVYLKCWNEGMEYERTGIFTSSTFKDLKRNIKLPKIW